MTIDRHGFIFLIKAGFFTNQMATDSELFKDKDELDNFLGDLLKKVNIPNTSTPVKMSNQDSQNQF